MKGGSRDKMEILLLVIAIIVIANITIALFSKLYNIILQSSFGETVKFLLLLNVGIINFSVVFGLTRLAINFTVLK